MKQYVCRICSAVTCADTKPWRCEKCTGRLLVPIPLVEAPNLQGVGV